MEKGTSGVADNRVFSNGCQIVPIEGYIQLADVNVRA